MAFKHDVIEKNSILLLVLTLLVVSVGGLVTVASGARTFCKFGASIRTGMELASNRDNTVLHSDARPGKPSVLHPCHPIDRPLRMTRLPPDAAHCSSLQQCCPAGVTRRGLLALAAPDIWAVDAARPGQRPAAGSDEDELWYAMDRAERDLQQHPSLVRDPALNDYVRGVACRGAADPSGAGGLAGDISTLAAMGAYGVMAWATVHVIAAW